MAERMGEPPWSWGSRKMTGSRAICTDILHFPARVLVIQAARRGYGRAPLIPDTVLPVYSGDRAIRFSRAVAAGRTGPGSGPGQGCWQCLAARQTEKASKALTFPPDRGFGDGHLARGETSASAAKLIRCDTPAQKCRLERRRS